jgi:hypothetical protein
MLFSIISYSQWGYGNINFDDNVNLYRIYIDSTLSNNIWQIGMPSKSTFISSHSNPNAIVTDLQNSYPINNTSIFYLRTSGDDFGDYHGAQLGFWYRMDSDTLIDFGKIEISIDSGQTWYNITAGNGYYWLYDSQGIKIKEYGGGEDTIVFSGISNGWYRIIYQMELPEQQIIDSIIYRFTFHSSSLNTSRDGWMIDDFEFFDLWESIPENKELYRVYPNPVKDEITINSKTLINKVEISNSLGSIVKKNENTLLPMHINVSDLPSGIYFYKLRFLTGQENFGKFIKIL